MNKPLSAFYKVSKDLSLTEVRKTDIEALVSHINDIEIFENTLSIPYPYNREDAEEYIALCRNFESKFKIISNFAIRNKGELIGGIGLLYNHGLESHKSEIGYWISKQYRKKGIMKKVLQEFMRICFDERSLTRLEANVFLENKASCKLLESVGFIKEGLIRASFMKEGQLKDTFLYSIIIKDPNG